MGSKLILWASALVLLTTSWIACAQEYEGTVLVLMPEGQVFEDVLQGLNDDIGEEIQFLPLAQKGLTLDVLNEQILQTQANLLVLLGNDALRLYQRYQAEQATPLPALATAALYLDDAIKDMSMVSGIRYEIPLVTSAVGYRSLSQAPISKIGVVHRDWMTSIIAENAAYCAQENLTLVPVALPDDSSRFQSRIRSAIRELAAQNVDLIWVVNDNALLNKSNLMTSWIPSLGRRNIPVIVGVEGLAETKLNLANFAVVPDHYNLGVQLAGMLAGALDEDWDVSQLDIEEPLSVKKTLNQTLSHRRQQPLIEQASDLVDRVIE